MSRATEGWLARLPRIAASAFVICLLALFSACARRPETAAGLPRKPGVPPDSHVPDFARRPYAPFARDSVIAIALREWRLFDRPVDDDPPGTRPPPLPEEKPE